MDAMVVHWGVKNSAISLPFGSTVWIVEVVLVWGCMRVCMCVCVGGEWGSDEPKLAELNKTKII